MTVCNSLAGQEKALECPELELQKVVSCLVGAETQTQVLCKSKCFKLLSHLPSPGLFELLVSEEFQSIMVEKGRCPE